LIEVKFRSGAGSPAEEFALKEAIVIKNADTQKVLEARFVPQSEADRIDREIQNKQLANLLQFYLDRCRRHGLIDTHIAESAALQTVIQAVTEGDFAVEFERAGFIYNLQGISKQPEQYKDNRIQVVGNDTIRELLDIPADVEAPPVQPAAELPPQLPEPPKPSQPPAPQTQTAKKSAVMEHKNGKEAESIRVNAAEQERPGSTTDRPAPVPARKHAEEPPPLPIEGVRILLGKNCDTKKDVYWDPYTPTPKKLANQHILIVGKSGAGKTQTAAGFMVELWNARVPCVIFDFQGEYMDAKLTNGNGKTFLECTEAEVLDAADGIDVNPLEVPNDPQTGNKQNFMKVVYQVATSLAKIFGLGDIQRAILRDAINQAFVVNGFVAGNKETWNSCPPTMSQVWGILKHLEKTEGGNVRNLNQSRRR
jgi:hypothetical protein